MKPRLNSATASTLSNVSQYDYDRAQGVGVVHLGVGAFHKAHQAYYFDQLMASGERDWMIQGASLKRPLAAEQLNPQDGLFSLVEHNSGDTAVHVLKCLREVEVANAAGSTLLQYLSDANTAVVTLTITEKGYCIDPASGRLNREDPLIIADLSGETAAQTAPGLLVAALETRYRNGIAPFTLLSCDNLSNNGVRLRTAVSELAHARDPKLGQWIDTELACPSSIVDRIVPATAAEDIEFIEQTLGVSDAATVRCEPFCQWVIEDQFCNRRPALEKVGVQFASAIAPWEKLKLRMLNAAHSVLAYYGALGGFEFVADAFAEPAYKRFVRAVWQEAEATLETVDGLNVEAYKQDLEARFLNSSLHHRTAQIAIDGSQKIPQRWLATIRERRAMGLDSPALSLAIAGWVCWQYGKDEQGQAFTVDDPLANETQKIVDRHSADPHALAFAISGLASVFGDDFQGDKVFVQNLGRDLATLLEAGASNTVGQRFS